MLYPAELRAHIWIVTATFAPRQWLRLGAGLAVALGLAGATAEAAAEATEEAGWVAVGEALVIELDSGERLRLAELAPEVPAATLRALLGGARLTFEPVGARQRTGHLPALVWEPGHASLQARLVEQGLAQVWPSHDAALATALLALEDAARTAGRGLWGSGDFRVLEATPTPSVEGFAIFRGEVVSVGRTDRFLYLNFGARFRESVSVRIRPRDGRSWGLTNRLDDLVGQRIEVRGFAFEDGGPMLELDHPAQLRVVD
ncbi:MAG: hypothetical protein EA356_11755 [Geminicoccaceae bacterium]|nr:MAG: hypothetical protein EA356_11755 [Geminicoccaceae bacterium]